MKKVVGLLAILLLISCSATKSDGTKVSQSQYKIDELMSWLNEGPCETQ